MKNSWIYIVLIFLCFGTLKIETHKESEPIKVSKAVWSDSGTSESSDVLAIEKSLESVSKEDCLIVYYLTSGIADYTEKYSGITKTNQINSLFRVVKSRYGKPDGWLDVDGPNNDLSDYLEMKTTEAGFNKPGEFTEESKKVFVEIYRTVAEQTLKAYKDKK